MAVGLGCTGNQAAGDANGEAGFGGAPAAGGNAGDGVTAVCLPGERLCEGNIPRTCDAAGQWLDGEPCAFMCQFGECVGECVGECEPTAGRCVDNIPEKCDGTGHWETLSACPPERPHCILGQCGSTVCTEANWCWESGAGGNVVWGFGVDDVWVAGTWVFHWDGTTWLATLPKEQWVAGATSTCNAPITDLWGVASHDIWAICGPIGPMHWNGTEWSEAVSSGVAEGCSAVHALWEVLPRTCGLSELRVAAAASTVNSSRSWCAGTGQRGSSRAMCTQDDSWHRGVCPKTTSGLLERTSLVKGPTTRLRRFIGMVST